MGSKPFPIGFWNYTMLGELTPENVRSFAERRFGKTVPAEISNEKLYASLKASCITPASVKDWAELGMNFTTSPSFVPGDDHDKVIELLDECEKYGIHVIMDDRRARWYGASDDRAAYAARFKEAADEFGGHPAVMGFHVGDEPWDDKAFADCIAANRVQLEVAPQLMPHLNLLPYWDGQEKDVLKAPSFNDWAVRMAKEADLKVLCYDCYTQMNPDEAGTDQYFKNLRIFSEAAIASGIPAWTTLLSVGHFRYRTPSEDDLRWQLNTAVASGMKGILWFFVYMRVPFSNYRVPPIDEFGERTATFDWLSRVNRHFQHEFGEFFMNTSHLGTRHLGKAYGGFELFRPEEFGGKLKAITCRQDLPAVVGYFRNAEGKLCVALVNNSVKEPGLFELHMPKAEGTVLKRMNWLGVFTDIKTDHHDAHYAETEDEIVGGDWLAPGQMKVYCIE